MGPREKARSAKGHMLCITNFLCNAGAKMCIKKTCVGSLWVGKEGEPARGTEGVSEEEAALSFI